METAAFVYNVLLIVLFSVTMALSLNHYVQKKNVLFLVISIMFGFYILDNTVISMTEMIDSFADTYNEIFLTVPAFKIIITMGYSSCGIYIIYALQKRKLCFKEYLILAALGIALLFIPMVEDRALMVWMFYLSAQLYLFYMAASGIYYLKKHHKEFEPGVQIKFIRILIINLVFAVLIVIEDTIVIFNYDIYSGLVVYINNRNMCEDILSIINAVTAIMYISTVSEAGQAEVSDEYVKKEPEKEALADDIQFVHFCRKYHLTVREQEILEILLQDKNNQEICEACSISVGTVKTHVHNIFTKTEVTKRSQLISIYNEFTKNMQEI